MWDKSSSNPCSLISCRLFRNFSYVDLSKNTITGSIPADFCACQNLKYLSLSRNLIERVFGLTGLSSLEVLDVSTNRHSGEIESYFPQICGRLVVANMSLNRLDGRSDHCFDSCHSLMYLDLSSNDFIGENWLGFGRLRQYSVSEKNLTGGVLKSSFAPGCSLLELDLSANQFFGEVPATTSNCLNLENLNLWGDGFTGKIPWQIGSMPYLHSLFLGSNRFSGEIPESLANCTSLSFLDLSSIKFDGEKCRMYELLNVGMKCTAEAPNSRPNMPEVVSMLLRISNTRACFNPT